MPNFINPLLYSPVYMDTDANHPTGIPVGTPFYNTTYKVLERWDGTSWNDISPILLYSDRCINENAGTTFNKEFDTSGQSANAFRVWGSVVNTSGANNNIQLRLNTYTGNTHDYISLNSTGVITTNNQTQLVICDMASGNQLSFDYLVTQVGTEGFVMGNGGVSNIANGIMVRGEIPGISANLTEIQVFSEGFATCEIVAQKALRDTRP